MLATIEAIHELLDEVSDEVKTLIAVEEVQLHDLRHAEEQRRASRRIGTYDVLISPQPEKTIALHATTMRNGTPQAGVLVFQHGRDIDEFSDALAAARINVLGTAEERCIPRLFAWPMDGGEAVAKRALKSSLQFPYNESVLAGRLSLLRLFTGWTPPDLPPNATSRAAS